MSDPTTRPIRGDRRMSDVEALMWNLEKDPALASTFANVTILDQPPDVERLRATMERAVRVVPRLRQRVVPAFGRLAPPLWQDDEDFDLDYHTRHPDRVPAVGREVVGAAQSLVRQASVTDHARSPLWKERSLRRRFEVVRIPLDDTKRAAKALGGSVNDIFVAGAAAAAGAYHR